MRLFSESSGFPAKESLLLVLKSALIADLTIKKKTLIPWLPDDAAFILSLLWPAVDRHRSFIHVAFTRAFRIAT